MHPRTELAKIYQHQNKYEEAERILLESLKIDNKQLHPRTELAKTYKTLGKYHKAETFLLEILEIHDKNIHAIAELISVYHKMSEPDRCFQRFDKFLAGIKLRKGRTPQPMFNNILKICYDFNRPDRANEYFQEYHHILDDRNNRLFKKLFGHFEDLQ